MLRVESRNGTITEFAHICDYKALAGQDTIDAIVKHHRIRMADRLITQTFGDGVIKEGMLNDWLWLEQEYIFEDLGIAE